MVAASWVKVTMFDNGATRERDDRATDKAGIAQRPIGGQRRNRTRQRINLIPHLSFPRVAAARGIPDSGGATSQSSLRSHQSGLLDSVSLSLVQRAIFLIDGLVDVAEMLEVH